MKPVTPLDELAYSIYSEEYKKFYCLASKHYFIIHKNSYNKYYIKATNIIRTQKIDKINENRR